MIKKSNNDSDKFGDHFIQLLLYSNDNEEIRIRYIVFSTVEIQIECNTRNFVRANTLLIRLGVIVSSQKELLDCTPSFVEL